MIRPLYIILLLLIAGAAIAFVPNWEGSESGYESGEVPVIDEPQTTNGFSAQIVINNPDWGSVTVKSFNGSTVVYSAVAKEGYHFSYWMNSKGQYIVVDGKYNSPDITYEQLDPKMTTAIFSEGDAEYSNFLTYNWYAPVYGEGGSYGSAPESFTVVLTQSEYDAAKDKNVHRKAVAGNTYITPWELVTYDSAVRQCVEYLQEKTVGQTDLQKAMTILWFVQDTIDYAKDSDLYGTNEYWAFPMETMYLGRGDCEDTAILYCSIAAKMGLDVGLVGFSYSDQTRAPYGHMGAAVALTNGASVQNATTFTMDGITYVYCETATDVRIDMGVLAYDPAKNLYMISDGTWTRIGYDATTELYTHENTRTIGANSNSGDIVYGDELSNPPTVNMRVGDRFYYQPQVNLPDAEMSSSGNGMSSSRGFLTFIDGILSGTATAVGEYTVTITAHWTNGELEQTAVQNIRFSVTEAPDSYSGQYTALQYSSGQWEIVTNAEPSASSDGSADDGKFLDLDSWQLIAVCVIAIGGGVLVITRF